MQGHEPIRMEPRAGRRDPNKPLPSPLPPPSRKGQVSVPPAVGAVSSAHVVPPSPHSATRLALSGGPDPHVASHDASAPQRSLASPPVLASLAASMLALCAFGWFSTRATDGSGWRGVKEVFHGGSSSLTVPDEDLPYITRVPIGPSEPAIAETNKGESEGVPRVVMTGPHQDSTAARDLKKMERR